MKNVMNTAAISLALLTALSSCRPAALPSDDTTAGAYVSGKYRVPFQEWNPQLKKADLQAKLDGAWTHYFTGTDDNARLYYPDGQNANGPLAYVLDTGNNDIRSEGMSYGMMIAVQMNKKAEFDAMWNWAYSKMLQAGGPQRGYFAWHLKTDGTKLDQNPASDGEEYFAAALMFASGRWGDGAGIYNYQGQANNILNIMLHKEDIAPAPGVSNMFGPDNQVVFVPDTTNNTFTDPSYHVPAFYDLFAQWAAGYKDEAADRARWAKIATTSRTVQFPGAVHPETGLSANYTRFDGSPYKIYGDNDQYGYDAWRVAMNWGMDAAWFGKQPQEKVWADRLQTFMEKEGMDKFANVYTREGVAQDEYHDSGHIAMVATAGLATSGPRSQKFTEALWNTEYITGQYRYYSGLLQFLGLLNASGEYKIYAPKTPGTPAPLPEPPVVVVPPAPTQKLTFGSFAAAPANATVQGAAFANYAYSEKPGDVVAKAVTKDATAISTAYTMSKAGGSSFGGVATFVEGKADNDGDSNTLAPATDLKSYTGMTIQLSATGTAQLQVKLVGTDKKVSDSGCYPVHLVDVTAAQATYTLQLDDATFAPRSYCGAGGKGLAETLPGVVRVEVEDNVLPASGTKAASMTIGTIEFTK
ncbi:glycosyl hydrolase family 8 [Deinococcus arenicola]|uniref:Glycosyl hydrolase family 8 n=1 Tax=Deinococcus arenicola TaxID=2994950 RepID=A0ABU4DV38_9DEIO|nr:glycosyl hydrolase family 8 [Deinococcus sp. ZS9-10]MDV6376296.1 glycosyl hydrolase family 8 [Deinococcus sp. ZS9-10]